MKILITGAGGFIGRNLCAVLKAGGEHEIFECEKDTPKDVLREFCRKADFVLCFSGANRPENPEDFMKINRDFTGEILSMLRSSGNSCPFLFASSVQASLSGKYARSEYGKSKLAAENLVFEHGEKTGAQVLVYRLPNVFGKWCRPNYNSAVATFCHNAANGKSIEISNPDAEIELLYIDRLAEEILSVLGGKINRCDYSKTALVPSERGKFCFVPGTYKTTLGEIAKIIKGFPDGGEIPSIPEKSLEKALFSTYLSYLPADKTAFFKKTHSDERGSFTELFRTEGSGQFSLNILEPGVLKGGHWHMTKAEIFTAVSGTGLIRIRNSVTGEIFEHRISGDKIEEILIPPGCAHEIINLSKTEKLITVIWASENFCPEKPDTYPGKVE